MRRSLPFVLLGVAEAAQQTQLVQRKRENAIMPRSWRRKSDTPVTRALLYANAIAYVALFQRSGAFRALAKNDRMIKSSRLQSYRLLSSCFLHANLPHLMINCYSLNNLGTTVEPYFGSRRTAVVYASAGLAGAALATDPPRALYQAQSRTLRRPKTLPHPD